MNGIEKMIDRRTSQQCTRQALLEAARILVIERGYQNVSILDIVKLAGYTKGAFFSNFKTKEDILIELMRLQKEADTELLTQCLNDGDLEKYISNLNERRDCTILDIELQLYGRNHPDFAQKYLVIQNENRFAIGEVLKIIFETHKKKIPMAPYELADLFIGLVQGAAIQNQSNITLFITTVLNSLLVSSHSI